MGPSGFPPPPHQPLGGHPPYPIPPPGWYPAPVDPLIPTDLTGWFDRWFRVFLRSFWRLSLITVIVGGAVLLVVGAFGAAIALLPGLGLLAGTDAADAPAATAATGLVIAAACLTGYVIFTWGQGASLYLAVLDAAGRHPRIAEALRFGARRALPLVGWYLLAAVVVLIGFLLLIIPGVYLMVAFNASLACTVVIERDGPGRCLELIRHRFWATFGRLVLSGLLAQGYAMAAQLVLAIPILGVSALIPTDPSGIVGPIVILVLIVVSVPLFVLPVVAASHAMNIVTYAELRGHENRGVTTWQIADELAGS